LLTLSGVMVEFFFLYMPPVKWATWLCIVKTFQNIYSQCLFLYLLNSFVVFKQVAVALSHAAILEESMRARDQLMEQNVALDLARREAEMAIHARNDFLAVMNHEMRTPMHAIIALSSLLLETELTPEQRVMIETVLKSSNVLATLINDVLDLSRLEDGSLELEMGKLNLHAVLGEVVAISFYALLFRNSSNIVLLSFTVY